MKKLDASSDSQGFSEPKVWHWRMYHENWHGKFYRAPQLLIIRKQVVKREVWKEKD